MIPEKAHMIIDAAEKWTKTRKCTSRVVDYTYDSERTPYVEIDIKNPAKLRRIFVKPECMDIASYSQTQYGPWQVSNYRPEWSWVGMEIVGKEEVGTINLQKHSSWYQIPGCFDKPKTHKIEWDVDEKWRKNLRTGDKIGVYPMIDAKGWKSCFMQAEVIVYYAL
ncbi:Protein of unknown function [Pyronema omphalodes CBS 100304]|uniref:Uncharacterized protein n=1 Tax=Pyronema omphalodes (strain CBS 100304) TaxID=1076935 RepID=U4LT56_PYROM|nr:Protein of unknown function [Pyronema omphalodes CBS 100304]